MSYPRLSRASTRAAYLILAGRSRRPPGCGLHT